MCRVLGVFMMVPKCDRCKRVNVQVVPVLGRDLCGQCCESFGSWVDAGPPETGVTPAMIQHATCDYFGLLIGDLLSERRHRAVSHPRMVAMYLCRNRLGLSFPEIGRRFGGRDHSSAIKACRKIDALVKAEDSAVVGAVEAIERHLEAA